MTTAGQTSHDSGNRDQQSPHPPMVADRASPAAGEKLNWRQGEVGATEDHVKPRNPRELREPRVEQGMVEVGHRSRRTDRDEHRDDDRK